jgi:excisionase family DNA binding protein
VGQERAVKAKCGIANITKGFKMTVKDDADDAKPMPPYTPLAAAAKAGVHRKTIYEGVRKRQVPSFRIGRKLLIPRRAFDRLVDEGKIA